MATKEIQKPPPPRGKAQDAKENVFKKTWDEMMKYLNGVKGEFKRVSWPTPQELRYNTVIVISVVVGISIYMLLVDQALNVLFRLLHKS